MTTELLIGGGIMLLGGIVQGCAGFGLALTTVPVLMLILPHTQVPPILVVLGIVNNLIVLLETRAAVNARLIWPLIVGGLVCLPLGAWLLTSLNAAAFKIGVGVVVLLAAGALLMGLRLAISPRWHNLLPVGMLSGLLGGSTSLSGPPVILFFANEGKGKQHFRGNLIAYFTLLNIGSIAVFWAFGLLSREVFVACAVYLIPLLIGTFIGMAIARRVNEQVFRRIVLALIAAIGLALIASNLKGLI